MDMEENVKKLRAFVAFEKQQLEKETGRVFSSLEAVVLNTDNSDDYSVGFVHGLEYALHLIGEKNERE